MDVVAYKQSACLLFQTRSFLPVRLAAAPKNILLFLICNSANVKMLMDRHTAKQEAQ